MKQISERPESTLLATHTRRSRTNTSAVKPNFRRTPDAYGKFLEETSPEVKDDFYLKLAGILLKRSQTSSDD